MARLLVVAIGLALALTGVTGRGEARDFEILAIHHGMSALSAIDPTGRSMEVDLGGAPRRLAYSADGEFAVLPIEERSLAVVRTDGRRLQATLAPSLKRNSEAPYFDASMSTRRGIVWGTRPEAGLLDVYNLWTKEQIGVAEASPRPGLIIASEDAGALFLFDLQEPTMRVIAMDDATETGQVELRAPVVRVIPGPAYQSLFFADADGRVGVIDAASYEVRYLRQYSDEPAGLAYLLDRGTLVVSLEHEGSLEGIDAFTGEVRFEIALNGRVGDISASPDGAEVYVAMQDQPILRVLDVEDRSVAEDIHLNSPVAALGIKVSTRPCAAL